jgi:hypothetical protein
LLSRVVSTRNYGLKYFLVYILKFEFTIGSSAIGSVRRYLMVDIIFIY